MLAYLNYYASKELGLASVRDLIMVLAWSMLKPIELRMVNTWHLTLYSKASMFLEENMKNHISHGSTQDLIY